MPANAYHISQEHLREFKLRDLSNVYTWSFPEFIPFCLHLFYYSSFKAFNTITRSA